MLETMLEYVGFIEKENSRCSLCEALVVRDSLEQLHTVFEPVLKGDLSWRT